MRLDIIDLKIIISISETKSLTETAKKNNLTTPAISYRLKAIEDSFDIRLFVRDQKGMNLTKAGMDFIIYAKNVLRSTDQLIYNLNKYKENKSGVIRLLANSSTLNAVTEKMALFLKDNPNVNIDLDERMSERIVWGVLEGEADVGLVAGDIDLRGLDSQPFGVDELVFIAALQHPIAKYQALSFKEAINYDMVAAGKNSSNFLFIQEFSRKIGADLRVRVHSHNFYSMIQCVKENVGIAVAPLSAVKDELEKNNVAIVKIAENWSQRKQQLVYKANNESPYFLLDFIHFLTN